jgi:hypothetical protein
MLVPNAAELYNDVVHTDPTGIFANPYMSVEIGSIYL